MRLDLYISQKLWVSRNRAQFFIIQQKIKVNWKVISKSSFDIKDNDLVEDDINDINYVSRSALKLKLFLEDQNMSVKDLVCLDIWASTWGFTQILIEKWVRKVYAVDVWSSQLHEKLKWNKKIISIENTDIRKFDKKVLKENILDLIVCDVSFISLTIIIDNILDLMSKDTIVILLFKPQFEVGVNNISKLWVVKDIKISQERLLNFSLILQKKWVKVCTIQNSKIKWENWNEETFILIKNKHELIKV